MQEPSPDPMPIPEGGYEALDLLLLPPAMLPLEDIDALLPPALTPDENPFPDTWDADAEADAIPAVAITQNPPSSPTPPPVQPPHPNPYPATPSTLLLPPPQHPHHHRNPRAPQTPRIAPLPTPTLPTIVTLPSSLPPNPQASRVTTWIRTLTPYFPAAAGFTIYPTIKVCPRTHVMYDLVVVCARRTGPYLTSVMGFDRPPEPDAWDRRVQVLQDEWRRGVVPGMPVYGAVWVGGEVRWFYGGDC